MDLISLYYFSELAKDLHMTRTADRLLISQQTLSNHIQKLERHYGTKLLHRKPALSLTPAGELVLNFANLVSREQANLKDTLSDLARQERGVLRFGAGALYLNMCLPTVLPEFSARYPNVELRITDTSAAQPEALVLDGSLDFAITSNGEEHPRLAAEPLADDPVCLCVADSLLQDCYGSAARSLKRNAILGADLRDFSQLPFCMLNNSMGRQISQCFEAAGITPRACITSAYPQAGITACFQGLAACFLSQTGLASQELPEDINIFPLYYAGQPLIRRLSLIRMKDRYLTSYSRFFLDQLSQSFSGAAQVHLHRAV